METLDSYKVNLKDVSTDTSAYDWHVDDAFFLAVHGSEITRGNLDVELNVRQRAEAYELIFHIQGQVAVPCDRCLEPVEIPIETDYVLKAKLGEEYEDDGDIVTVPYEDGIINVAWHIYEIAALEIPLRHVHPDGLCARDFEESAEPGRQEQASIDPRWNELRKILDNNKK